MKSGKAHVPYKVLVIDDSAVVRQTMQQILNESPDLEVIATASDPFVAVERIKKQIPDVITLDVEMPRMDGITFLRRLMAQRPIPVVMCSSLVSDQSKTLSQAIEAGAVDIICKPELGLKEFFEESCTRICDTVAAAAQAKLGALRPIQIEKRLSADAMLAPPGGGAMARTTETVVAIGASTGGTQALKNVLEVLPVDCPPIVVVQHMPEKFTEAFAERLDKLCAVKIKEAKDGDRMLRGHVLIAPGNQHTMLTRSGANYSVEVREGPLVSRHRPSVDVLFRSFARVAARNAVGVIMTGMGDDGAKGLLEMRMAGARTIGQDESSCVVYGMPNEAKKAGAVELEVHLQKIPETLLKFARSIR